ncbi:unnamed protein product [Gongylonema pulchrum]|uniref:Ion_trans domain-containing protein n=1 Tax=Gongylonema pulchrum TaxID=637853 RepID=A0A183D5Z9_9BILA|nr:unnamed protein product [Gongylonema pulchrum]
MKFLYYSISFGCFLLLLTAATFEHYRYEKGEVKGGGNNRAADRGPPPTLIESLVFLWVFGMFWSEVKQIWEEGFKKYIYQWWNWLDFLMMSLYICMISLSKVTNGSLFELIGIHWSQCLLLRRYSLWPIYSAFLGSFICSR